MAVWILNYFLLTSHPFEIYWALDVYFQTSLFCECSLKLRDKSFPRSQQSMVDVHVTIVSLEQRLVYEKLLYMVNKEVGWVELVGFETFHCLQPL